MQQGLVFRGADAIGVQLVDGADLQAVDNEVNGFADRRSLRRI